MARTYRAPLEIGATYNMLTVLSFSHLDKRKRRWYNTVCKCGNNKIIMGSAMISNNTKSCGCFTSRYKREAGLLPDSLSVKRHIVLQYKRHARNRNISFDISSEDFISLLTQNCFYCNCSPSNLKKTKNLKQGFLYNGVDRLNSDLNYTKDNCVPCCKKCNYAKADMTVNEFLAWVKRLYEFKLKKKTTQWSKPYIKPTLF